MDCGQVDIIHVTPHRKMIWGCGEQIGALIHTCNLHETSRFFRVDLLLMPHSLYTRITIIINDKEDKQGNVSPKYLASSTCCGYRLESMHSMLQAIDKRANYT